MEVMPQLTPEVIGLDVKTNKEVVVQHHLDKADLEEVVEEALFKRRSATTTTTTRTISDGSTLTTISSETITTSSSSSASGDIDESAAAAAVVNEEPPAHGDDNEKQGEHSVYFDKNEGLGLLEELQNTEETYELGESDEEVVELEFETAVTKMHTHTDYNMYCPKCSNRITKVVLRRKIRRRAPAEPSQLFGCASCFSVFTSAGNKLNPFKIFDSSRDNTQFIQEPQTTDVPPFDPAQVIGTGRKGFDPFWFFRSGKDKEITSTTPLLPGTETGTQSSFPIQKPIEEVIKQGRKFDLFGRFGSMFTAAAAIQSKPSGDGITEEIGASQPGKDETSAGSPIDVEKHETIVQQPSQPDPFIILEERDTYFQPPGVDDVRIPIEEEAPAPLQTGIPQPAVPLVPTEPASSRSFEIMKSIVYGGLMETIASLGVVSSAAASDSTTLNIVVLGLANLVGGLVVLVHNLRDLRFGDSSQTNEQKYKEELGRKEHFLMHATVAILSYIIFGLIPPAIYGYSFRETNDRDYKMLAVAAASLICIFFLAIGKTYARGDHKFSTYFKTVLYYITSAVAASGIAFAVGDLTEKLLQQLGWLDNNPSAPVGSGRLFAGPNSLYQPTSWASY